MFYHRKVNDFRRLTTPEYVPEALKWLKKEEEMADIFYSESKRAIVQRVEKILIRDQAEYLASNEQSGLINMIRTEKYDDIRALNQLLHRAEDKIQLLADKLYAYIDESGKTLLATVTQKIQERVNKREVAESYVLDVLNLKKKVDKVTQEYLNNNLKIQAKRDIGFKDILNIGNKYFAEFLAVYCDILMKKESLGTETEENEHLNTVASILS